jgi:hypothetical protein
VLSFHLLEEPVRRSRWLSAKPAGYQGLSFAQWYRENKRGLDIALVGGAVTALFLAGWIDTTGGTTTGPALAADRTISAPPAGSAALTAQQRLVLDALQQKRWGRLDPSLDTLTDSLAPEWIADGCINIGPANEARCDYGATSASRTAVVMGDSIAVSWMPAIRAALGVGWRVQLLTLGECPVPQLPTWRNAHSVGKVFDGCVQHREWVTGELTRLRPDLVIASSHAAYARRVVGQPNDGRAADYAAWRTGLQQALEPARTVGARIVVLSEPPATGNLQTCVTAVSRPASCVQRVSPTWEKVRTAEAAAADALGAAYLDASAWTCYSGLCPAVIDGTPVMWDGTHLTRQFAARLAEPLKRALAPLLRTGASG